MGLAEDVRRGDRRAAAKLISLIEDEDPTAPDLLAALHAHTGHAHVIGVTGPPGTGKSTLIGQLIEEFRKRKRKVGVIAVDPTSPYTGGALLGDRVRMQDATTDPGVFIRSMGTRGHGGGLARAAYDAVKVLDALGMDLVFVETVGAGQAEVEVAQLAHTTMVVEMPGTGDEVQALKAGLLEIADVYVVNKGDREGADAAARELESVSRPRDGWTPPVVRTVALEGEGVAAVADALESHRKHLEAGGGWGARERARLRREFVDAFQGVVLAEVAANRDFEALFEKQLQRVLDRQASPREAAREVLRRLG